MMPAAPADIDVQENEAQTPVSISLDPKEIKRQKARLYYAQNREEILKRQRQSREQKKKSIALLDINDTLTHSPVTGQSAVTEVHKITSTDLSTRPESSQSLGGIPQENENNVNDENDSNWLHKNDAFQMQKIAGRMRAVAVPLGHNKPERTQHNTQPPTQLSGVEIPQVSRIVNLHTSGHTFQNSGNNQQEKDAYGIFEPNNHLLNFDECLDGVHNNNGQVTHDEIDEEAMILREHRVDYESLREEPQSTEGNPMNDDIANRIYGNLPSRHHVLRKY
uniref:Uncharacterized protein n=1 Tax=Avena sativa TaxID=4498 RepID=A0ACD6ATD3_AVESA